MCTTYKHKYTHIMHLHYKKDSPNLHSRIIKSLRPMHLSAVPTRVSDGVHAGICLPLLHVHARVSVCCLCAQETLLCKRFFVTARCSGSVYVMGEGG